MILRAGDCHSQQERRHHWCLAASWHTFLGRAIRRFTLVRCRCSTVPTCYTARISVQSVYKDEAYYQSPCIPLGGLWMVAIAWLLLPQPFQTISSPVFGRSHEQAPA